LEKKEKEDFFTKGGQNKLRCPTEQRVKKKQGTGNPPKQPGDKKGRKRNHLQKRKIAKTQRPPSKGGIEKGKKRGKKKNKNWTYEEKRWGGGGSPRKKLKKGGIPKGIKVPFPSTLNSYLGWGGVQRY